MDSEKPSANATVVTYEMANHLVYLTNQPPTSGVHVRKSGELYAWISGVAEPSGAERDAIAGALTAHNDGGSVALETEVRKLQDSKEPPPSASTTL